jgi:DNA-binding response OmpR family regulator
VSDAVSGPIKVLVIDDSNTIRRSAEIFLRQAGFDGERYWDLVIFGILKDEIDAQRQKDKVHLPLESSEGNGREPA